MLCNGVKLSIPCVFSIVHNIFSCLKMSVSKTDAHTPSALPSWVPPQLETDPPTTQDPRVSASTTPVPTRRPGRCSSLCVPPPTPRRASPLPPLLLSADPGRVAHHHLVSTPEMPLLPGCPCNLSPPIARVTLLKHHLDRDLSWSKTFNTSLLPELRGLRDWALPTPLASPSPRHPSHQALLPALLLCHLQPDLPLPLPPSTLFNVEVSARSPLSEETSPLPLQAGCASQAALAPRLRKQPSPQAPGRWAWGGLCS